MLSIKGHCSYLGETGYNYHSRNFFRSLAKFTPDLKIRNFTVCSKTDEYLIELDRQILSEQTLFITDSSMGEFPIFNNERITDEFRFEEKINIVLNPVNHYYFFNDYNGPKIAYVVWETTLFPDLFFNKLLEFDQLWVPSYWQKDNAIKQGYPKDKIFIIPEGLDDDLFNKKTIVPPENGFNFLLGGKLEYRKATKEIIETFLQTFKPSENVNLILNIDNQFSGVSTVNYLKENNLLNEKIIIKPFQSWDDYINLIKSCDIFVSCSRGEGWNRPLHESLAVGTPSIYSNYGPQLEFTMRSPLKVNILEERQANFNNENKNLPGNWCEPDFNHLSRVMRESYDNYSFYREDAMNRAKNIKKMFKNEEVAKHAYNIIEKSFPSNFWNKEEDSTLFF